MRICGTTLKLQYVLKFSCALKLLCEPQPGNDVVVPAISEFSILKNPLGQIVTLLSGSAHVKLKMLHIRSTIRSRS